MILDGSLITCDRVAATTVKTKGKNRGRIVHLWYSGKHRAFGGNIQFLATPDGFPLWVSPALPGSRNDLSAARDHGITGALTAAAAHGLKPWPTRPTTASSPRSRTPQVNHLSTPGNGPTICCTPGPGPAANAHGHPENPLVSPAPSHPLPTPASARSSKRPWSSHIMNTRAATKKTSLWAPPRR